MTDSLLVRTVLCSNNINVCHQNSKSEQIAQLPCDHNSVDVTDLMTNECYNNESPGGRYLFRANVTLA